jgi:hypothetical protein
MLQTSFYVYLAIGIILVGCLMLGYALGASATYERANQQCNEYVSRLNCVEETRQEKTPWINLTLINLSEMN